jgi:hypothetical protein
MSSNATRKLRLSKALGIKIRADRKQKLKDLTQKKKQVSKVKPKTTLEKLYDNDKSSSESCSSNQLYKNTAIFSEDRKFRFLLNRTWDENKPIVCFVMNKPSKANEVDNDRTINRVISFVKSWECGGFYVININPTYDNNDNELSQNVIDENKQYIKFAVENSEKIIYCYGSTIGLPDYISNMVNTPYCLELSVNGCPKQITRLKNNLKPVVIGKK